MIELYKCGRFIIQHNKKLLFFSLLFMISYVAFNIITNVFEEEAGIEGIYIASCFYFIVSAAIYFYDVEKNKIISLEIINDHSLNNVFWGNYICCMIHYMLYISIIHIVLMIISPSLFAHSFLHFFVFLIVCWKIISIVFMISFFLRQALLLAVAEWFVFSFGHIVLLIVNETKNIKCFWALSLLLLSKMNSDGINIFDLTIWMVLSFIEILVLYNALKLVNRNAEWI